MNGFKVWVLRGDARFVTPVKGWYWTVHDANDMDVACGGSKYTSFQEACDESLDAVPVPSPA